MAEVKRAVSREERLRENRTEIEEGGKSKNIMGERMKKENGKEQGRITEDRRKRQKIYYNSETRSGTKLVFH